MTLPLSGIKVLELARGLAGPLVGQMLGDFGADVIKVEPPGEGDESRSMGATFLKAWDGSNTRESAFYLSANRNKRSITVDVPTTEGREIVRALALLADVVIEDFPAGILATYHLDYASLSTANPKIVHLSIARDVQAGNDAETRSALHGSIAVLGALNFRDRQTDAHGQHIELSLFDSMVSSLTHHMQEVLLSGARSAVTPRELIPDEQLRERGLVVGAKHPVAAIVPVVANPIRYSETRLVRYDAPPLLGAHTEQVLAELGLSGAQVESLRLAKVV